MVKAVLATIQFGKVLMLSLLHVVTIHSVTNLFTATFFGQGADKAVNDIGNMLSKASGLSDILIMLIIINFGLALCNIIPFPPLDGYHILKDLFQGLTGRTVIALVFSTVPVIYWLTEHRCQKQ